MGGITTWRSGFHINPSAGVNRANTNINVDRPDATGQSVSLDTPTTERWFNTAAFALQPIYQFGNAARNSVPGPAGFMLDSNVQKNFRIMEGHELQFRWESYNLLNHPVWGFPNTNLSSPNFGRITSTGGQYAADAVCPEVRVLIEPMLTFSLRCALIAVFALGSAAQNSSKLDRAIPGASHRRQFVLRRFAGTCLVPDHHAGRAHPDQQQPGKFRADDRGQHRETGLPVLGCEDPAGQPRTLGSQRGQRAVKERTGAKYMVMEPDVAVTEDGGKSDFFYGESPESLYPTGEGGPRLT